MAYVIMAKEAPVPLSLRGGLPLPVLTFINVYRKRLTVFLLLLVVTASSAFGNDKTFAIGLGPEINMNSGSAFGVSAALAVDFNFADYWAAGLTAKGSYDFSSAWVVEGGVLVRRYFSGREPRQGEKHSGFFGQLEGGVHLIVEDNVFMYEGDTLLRPMGGLRLGCRFLLGSGRSFYLEPYARGGYPFLWGAGLIAGFRI